MAIKSGLQLGLNQRLTMTPQLRQALNLLQMPALDLQQHVSDMLDSNVLLETQEPEPSPDSTDADTRATHEALADLDIPHFADTHWQPSRAATTDTDLLRERTVAPPPSLHAHLNWQLSLAPLSETDFVIGAIIIDALDDNGYLHTTLGDIAHSLQPDIEANEAEVEAVLHRIQTFDPPGIGARTLQECLQLQLKMLDAHTPEKTAAQAIVGHHLDAFAAGKYSVIREQLSLDTATFDHATALIRQLDPRPGESVAPKPPDYVIPDVLVVRRQGRWHGVVNPAVVPRLQVNATYARHIRGDRNQQPLRDQLTQARWLLRSLDMRGETLHRVANAIIEHQQAFIELGAEALKPLGLKEIAQQLELHESTISRVCAHKWMATPRGLLAFRDFFSNAVSGASTSAYSATAIRAMIGAMIREEKPAKPLSDSRIARNLSERGITVARRTVAKYREALSIPPSHQRKS